MDEDFYEEISDQDKVVPGVPPVAVLVAVVASLNVEVPEILDKSESPSPGPSSPVSSGPPSPPASPRGDIPSFMGFYTSDDLMELEQWAVDARAFRNQPELRVEEPDISRNLKVFLRLALGPQWKLCLLRQSGEVLFEQLRNYLAGYKQLTSFNCRQWLRLFPAWTATERQEQLELLADAGGFWVL